jgi:hypothetical protein
MGQQRGEVRVDLQQDPEYDKWAGKGKTTKDLLTAHIRLSAAEEGQTKLKAVSHEKNDPNRHVWSGKPGWFAASYGPFRRFSGGDKETENRCDTDTSLWPVSDRATRLTEGLQDRGRPSLGGFGGVGDPRRAVESTLRTFADMTGVPSLKMTDFANCLQETTYASVTSREHLQKQLCGHFRTHPDMARFRSESTSETGSC